MNLRKLSDEIKELLKGIDDSRARTLLTLLHPNLFIRGLPFSLITPTA
jgi:hypothetical protein